MRALALHGLLVKEQALDAYIKKHKKVPLAAHYMLADWRQRLHNSRVAYSRLCEILETAEVTFYIADALKVCKCHGVWQGFSEVDGLMMVGAEELGCPVVVGCLGM